MTQKVMVETIVGHAGSNAVNRVVEELGHPPCFEMHERFTDVFVITSGMVRFMYGGELLEQRGGRNGEWTGSNIIGGKEVVLERGDTLVVDAGKPHVHWVLPSPEGFSMVVVKLKAKR